MNNKNESKEAKNMDACKKKKLLRHGNNVCIGFLVAIAFLIFKHTGLCNAALADTIATLTSIYGAFHLGMYYTLNKYWRV